MPGIPLCGEIVNAFHILRIQANRIASGHAGQAGLEVAFVRLVRHRLDLGG